jgi:hypothetical protein
MYASARVGATRVRLGPPPRATGIRIHREGRPAPSGGQAAEAPRPLILVLSNAANEAASDLVGMFPPGAASLVTASSFNASFTAGISVGDFAPSEITIGGKRTRAGQISGVISTIAHFLPQELYYIEPEDREYICAELGAFFIAFLSALGCRKLNPPSSRTLSGLGMHRIEWLRSAHGCGVPIWPVRMRNGVPLAGEEARAMRWFRATIIGDLVVERGIPAMIDAYMRALSRAFSMPYLSCSFVSPGDDEFLLADLSSLPDIGAAANRDAMVRYLEREA